jgi:hypothetical protein
VCEFSSSVSCDELSISASLPTVGKSKAETVDGT